MYLLKKILKFNKKVSKILLKIYFNLKTFSINKHHHISIDYLIFPASLYCVPLFLIYPFARNVESIEGEFGISRRS